MQYHKYHIKVMTRKLLASFLWTQCIYILYIHF